MRHIYFLEIKEGLNQTLKGSIYEQKSPSLTIIFKKDWLLGEFAHC